MRELILIVLGALLFLQVTLGEARAVEEMLLCDGSRVDRGSLEPPAAEGPVDAPAGRLPIPVDLALQLTELNAIDELTSSFRFEGFMEFRICDPRSAFD